MGGKGEEGGLCPVWTWLYIVLLDYGNGWFTSRMSSSKKVGLSGEKRVTNPLIDKMKLIMSHT